jgi:hypothetical protein
MVSQGTGRSGLLERKHSIDPGPLPFKKVQIVKSEVHESCCPYRELIRTVGDWAVFPVHNAK